MNLWVIFLTGLTTGGLSCLAMQGGLLASVIANQKDDERQKSARPSSWLQFDVLDWLPVSMFLVAKLVIHTVLGFLLGALGSVISLSLGLRLTFQVFTALFMLATAGNLLNLHPIFRYVVFQPPKFINRLVRNTSKSRALFTPAVLGLLTVFIPCGVTQAMEVLAINTANPVYGAAIMFAFVLGTSPLFALVGVATAKLSENLMAQFQQVAAIALILMALYGINGVLRVLDSPLAIQNIMDRLDSMAYVLAQGSSAQNDAKVKGAAVTDPNVRIENGVQKVTLNILATGYSPNQFAVKAGMPVELTLKTNGVYSCASSFAFRQFKVFEQLEPTDSRTVAFTPNEKGSFRFSCSMGMYGGIMRVI